MEENILLKDKKLCECGCGQLIAAINKKGKPAKFKHGHNPQPQRVIIKVKEKRICNRCGSTETRLERQIRQNGKICEYPRWFRDKEKGCGLMCDKCRSKYVDHPKQNKQKRQEENKRRVQFRKKAVILKTSPRIGVCNLCRAVAPFDCKRTDMHHDYYDEANPLTGTIEVCIPCHRKSDKMRTQSFYKLWYSFLQLY